MGLAGGLVSSAVYYLLSKRLAAAAEDEIVTLKKNLVQELKQHPFDPSKGDDYLFTREFMGLLFRLLYTYQTVAREVVKEQYFQMRLEHLRNNDAQAYKQSVEKRNAVLT